MKISYYDPETGMYYWDWCHPDMEAEESDVIAMLDAAMNEEGFAHIEDVGSRKQGAEQVYYLIYVTRKRK